MKSVTKWVSNGGGRGGVFLGEKGKQAAVSDSGCCLRSKNDKRKFKGEFLWPTEGYCQKAKHLQQNRKGQ